MKKNQVRVTNKTFEESDQPIEYKVKSRKNSFSRVSTKESQSMNNSLNIGNFQQSDLSQNYAKLINSLQEKLNIYENEMKSLIEEKIQMQMIINSLTQEKSNKYVNQKFDDLHNQLERQKKLLQDDDSICETSSRESNQLALQREVIVKEIKELKDELLMLTELHKSISNEILDKSKTENSLTQSVIHHPDNKSRNAVTSKKHVNNFINESSEKSTQSINLSQISNENLPNIEQFFVYNNKYSLVDSDKNLWHLTKCKKFLRFTKENKASNKTKEENLLAFIEYYQSTTQEQGGGCQDDIVEISERSEISKSKQASENSLNLSDSN